MFQAISDYLSRASEDIGNGWNRFWYRPANPLPLAMVRIVAGLFAFYYLASFSFTLQDWFGPRGLLPVSWVPQLLDDLGVAGGYHPSLLNLAQTSSELWVLHAIGLVAAALLTLGLFSRVTSLVTLVYVLSYIHRAPMIVGQMEPVLAMVLLYLCIGPSGAYCSLDRLWRQRKGGADAREPAPCWSANLSLRLLQVHLAGLYLVIALSQTAIPAWQDGTAIWWMASLSESRLIDITGWFTGVPFLANLLTHAVVVFEFCFAVLVWNRTARPLLLAISIPVWLLLALLTGLVGYCLLMLAAGAAFIPASAWQAMLGRKAEASQVRAAVAA